MSEERSESAFIKEADVKLGELRKLMDSVPNPESYERSVIVIVSENYGDTTARLFGVQGSLAELAAGLASLPENVDEKIIRLAELMTQLAKMKKYSVENE